MRHQPRSRWTLVRRLLAAIVTAALLHVQSAHAQAPASVPAPSMHAVTLSLLDSINKDRAQHHLPLLSLKPALSKCSRSHSKHMASVGYLSHDEFPSDVCMTYRWAGENVGMASGDPGEAVLTLHGIMMKEGPCPAPCSAQDREAHGHYLNLVSRHFRYVGIGLVEVDGTVWLTEDFTG